MSLVELIKKVNQFSSGEDTTVPTKDGELSTLIKLRMKQPRDLIKNTVFTSIDHSTSDQECQWEELLKVSVLTMLF